VALASISPHYGSSVSVSRISGSAPLDDFGDLRPSWRDKRQKSATGIDAKSLKPNLGEANFSQVDAIETPVAKMKNLF
jgi:hypothetical protein